MRPRLHNNLMVWKGRATQRRSRGEACVNATASAVWRAKQRKRAEEDWHHSQSSQSSSFLVQGCSQQHHQLTGTPECCHDSHLEDLIIISYSLLSSRFFKRMSVPGSLPPPSGMACILHKVLWSRLGCLRGNRFNKLWRGCCVNGGLSSFTDSEQLTRKWCPTGWRRLRTTYWWCPGRVSWAGSPSPSHLQTHVTCDGLKTLQGWWK